MLSPKTRTYGVFDWGFGFHSHNESYSYRNKPVTALSFELFYEDVPMY